MGIAQNPPQWVIDVCDVNTELCNFLNMIARDMRFVSLCSSNECLAGRKIFDEVAPMGKAPKSKRTYKFRVLAEMCLLESRKRYNCAPYRKLDTISTW